MNMYRRVNIAEMRGMFATSDHSRFLVVSENGGYVLTFSGCVLLTFRGQDHVFKSLDSVYGFVKRHFVDVFCRSAVFEIVIS